ncbi:MAG: molybdopterin-dependent oxidoreductase [Desulfurococcales archaeon]|nr:molybdopterin-dependent oxidoreductase [Desulfurococcales archaeon]
MVSNEDFYPGSTSCPRSVGDFKRARSDQRVDGAYRARVKGSRSFERIPLDEAVGLLVDRLKHVVSRYGARSVLFVDYAGNRGLLTRVLPARFWRLLGASLVMHNLCDYSGLKALRLHYGSSYGRLPRDVLESRLIVYWGVNTAVSSIHSFQLALRARREAGAVIVNVDPRVSETARASDLHLRPKPGSDGYLALGVANYIIENGLYDREFVAKYTRGFSEFAAYASRFTLDVVSSVTGVDSRLIEEFASMYASLKPSIIHIGYGLQRRYGGGEIVRAIALLPALVGVHRGFYYSNTDGLPVDVDRLSGPTPRIVIPQSMLGEYISAGRAKLVFIHLTNPAATYPDAGKVRQGLLRDDVFVVVHETHWSDTALYADLVIPAPTYLEKEDFVYGYWHNYIIHNEKIVKPGFETITELELVRRISAGIGIDDSLLDSDPWDIVSSLIGEKLAGELKGKGYAALPYRSYSEYQTPSGMIEFYSTRAVEEGFNPLPQPGQALPDTGYSLILLSGAHPLYTHSQFEDVYGPIPPVVMISPEDAEERGISSGDVVRVYNERGSILMKARVSGSLPRGVVFVYRSASTLDGGRVNVLSDPGLDSFGGSVINSTRVEVERHAS